MSRLIFNHDTGRNYDLILTKFCRGWNADVFPDFAVALEDTFIDQSKFGMR